MSTSYFSRLLRLRAAVCLLFAGLLFFLVSPNVFGLTLSVALAFVLVGASR